jgi:hypothetical protein
LTFRHASVQRPAQTFGGLAQVVHPFAQLANAFHVIDGGSIDRDLVDRRPLGHARSGRMIQEAPAGN